MEPVQQPLAELLPVVHAFSYSASIMGRGRVMEETSLLRRSEGGGVVVDLHLVAFSY